MADPADLADAYHVYSQLLDAAEQHSGDLEQLQKQADGTHKDLLNQLAEAQQHGDQAAIERVQNAIDDAQEAWIQAQQELQQDQPPQEDPNDAPDVHQGEPAEQPGDVAAVPQDDPDPGDQD